MLEVIIRTVAAGLGGGCFGYLVVKRRRTADKWRFSVMELLVGMTMVAAYVILARYGN
jgi:hypothetical protein